MEVADDIVQAVVPLVRDEKYFLGAMAAWVEIDEQIERRISLWASNELLAQAPTEIN